MTLAHKAIRFLKIFGPRIFLRRLVDVVQSYALGMALPILRDCKSIALAEVNTERPKVLFFSGIEWNYRIQRPQHLSRELARLGYNVYYCAPSTIPSRSEGWYKSTIPDSNKLWHVRFFSQKRASLNECASDTSTQEVVAANIQRIVNALRTNDKPITVIVEHPLWFSVLKSIEGVRIVYDCIDDYGAFTDAHSQVQALEHRLASAASVIVSTSDGLAQRWYGLSAVQKVIRNGCCYEHFSRRPSRVYSAPTPKVIGYHGAIEDWFDVHLVEQVAQAYPQHTLLLVGGALPSIAQRLKVYPNIHMTGEIPYTQLPYYIHAFDVGLLPFRIYDLTLNTNPVKIYEYFAAGLPVVAVPLPEMVQFGDLVSMGSGQVFVNAIGRALYGDDGKQRERQEFAQKNSWAARGKEFTECFKSIHDMKF